MNIQAEVSLYPLREPSLTPAIDAFMEGLRRPGICLRSGAMSTVISGERQAVFEAVADSFARVADEHQVVLTVKYSNACPTDSCEVAK
ncbi:MAG: YkoF family thiamine/hydroxymethylpyrimidine-binding protein [Syntrophotalea acetylenica]|jgi:uncharacterized protein YqgV (UPF0045/DUF77 family)|uniref:Thiamin/hydroxymethyl pyrimidine-binding YkoF putative domain-containing protein n=1 Tax=Syntrophotalea acetylenica TaxID=29542 RepID=A0A1L3GI45_SYNAC|nr:YkoF family thiamine/hydroxymethylpyrimidine-binding protein [Syntrophotalea acetylenica]APG25559.1 hypothetical protein A7E75_11435 [Syntrophotalea acetylenica]APG43626.1 hypothetical protein A6070_05450 [Syntrophotalea acetylenica]MDD4457217.1 YkoF family thiamine/hydroxymethylpyrimidine-binding protein [Syntrophotalea acetylenica]MDY0263479.1 YkoF family thiamine/hydroxymethylpyrimidine-binding protein [Syntrophotalea acetylenica]